MANSQKKLMQRLLFVNVGGFLRTRVLDNVWKRDERE
jgi:hypothetical protein